MKIVKAYPPNWDEIKVLNPATDSVFCYGDTIYNPSEGEIPEDVLYHESVHKKQQSKFRNPRTWWIRYINDTDFRKNEEIEAFGNQLAFVRKHYPVRAQKEALSEMVLNLIAKYQLDMSYTQAELAIKNASRGVILD